MSNNVLVIKGADFSAQAVDYIGLPEGVEIQTGKALQSDGTAYINATEFFGGTKSFNATNSEFHIEFEIPSTYSSARSIYGIAVSSPSSTMLHLVSLANSSNLRIDDGNYGNNPVYINSVVGHRVIYDRVGVNIVATIDGTPTQYVNNVNPNAIATGDFFLFALCNIPNGGVASNIANSVKIYSASLKMNGVPIFDIVACTYNDAPAMYDYVSGKVLTAADGGTFTLTD